MRSLRSLCYCCVLDALYSGECRDVVDGFLVSSRE